MSDETLWKERAEHYCKVVENLVQQVSVAARLGETFDLFKTHVNDGARQLNSILNRIGVAVCSLEATAKRFEAIQAPDPGTMHQVEMRTSTTYVEDDDAPDSDDLDDDDDGVLTLSIKVRTEEFGYVIDELELTPDEARRFFRNRHTATFDLDFERDAAGDILVSGRVQERR